MAVPDTMLATMECAAPGTDLHHEAPSPAPTVKLKTLDDLLHDEITKYANASGESLYTEAGAAIEEDCLTFWKTSYAQKTFPILRVLVRMVVTVAAQAESERTGSGIENIVTKKRCRIRPRLASAMLFIRQQGW